MRLFALAAVCLLSAAPACAAVDCNGAAAKLAVAWVERQPATSPGAEISVQNGLCIQDALVAALAAQAGKPIGYKVGLTSKPAQEMFKVDSPVAGVLLAGMLKATPAKLPAAFGGRPIWEADLLVTVADAGVNDAATPLEVANHLGQVVPFIELPDLVLAKGEPMSMPVLLAINVGARAGVVGEAIRVQPSAEFVDALANMTVVATDSSGKELGRLPGKAILGHPLNSVIWLAQDLKRRGKALKAGDVISLGSFGAPQPPQPGMTVTVTYEGLPGAKPVSVAFE